MMYVLVSRKKVFLMKKYPRILRVYGIIANFIPINCNLYMKPLIKETLKEVGRVFVIAFIAITICNVIDGFNFSKLLTALPCLVAIDAVFGVIYYFGHK